MQLSYFIAFILLVVCAFSVPQGHAESGDGDDNKIPCSATNSCPPKPPEPPKDDDDDDDDDEDKYDCTKDYDRINKWEEDTELMEEMHTENVQTIKVYCSRSTLYRKADWKSQGGSE